MKKTALALLALLCLLLALTCLVSCAKKDEFSPPTGMKLATDEQATFHFYVPEAWTVDYSTAAAGAYYSLSDPSSVSVMAWELPNTDSTVDDWWELNVGEIEKVFSDVAVESAENATVDGVYAKKYTYTATLGEYAYRFQQVAAIKDGAVYLFTYTSLPENFDKHLEDVGQMLEFLLLR